MGVPAEGLHADARWLRRQAIEIVIQLPDNEKDALAVLSLARELIVGFIAGRMDSGKVAPFKRELSG